MTAVTISSDFGAPQNNWGTRLLEGTNKTLCAPGPRDPTETEPELCLSIFYEGPGQQWRAAGAGALGAVDLGMA